MEDNLRANETDEIKDKKDNDEIKNEDINEIKVNINENKDNINENKDNINDEEDNNLLNEKDKNENIINAKNEEVILTKNNKENIDIKNEQQVNNNIKNENIIIGDYLITIQYTKYFKIPYFIFGNMVNFYCPCYKFKSKTINLSQIPTPPFGINIPECK